MPSVLMIVSRERPGLYAHLCQEFEGDQAIAVVLDRRFGERARASESSTPEEQQAERRRRGVDQQLRSLGWATVTAG